MNDFFWQLPGPRQFLKNILTDLKEGHSIFFILPQTMPKNFVSQLRAYATHELREMNWDHLFVADQTPLETLFKRLDPLSSSKLVRSVPNLYELNHFSSKLFFLENISEKMWPEWKKFLKEYTIFSQKKSLTQRTLFIVQAPLSEDVKQEKQEIKLHSWSGVFDELDMTLYVSSHLKSRNLQPLYKKLALSIIACLSLWDTALADILLQESIENLLKPLPILEHFGRKRNWEQHTLKNREGCWQQGIFYKMETQEQIHSAFLAIHGPLQELNYRLWRSHLQVLFPYVEEQRQSLIPQLSKFLSLPFETTSGVLIQDPLELELGHILQLLFLSTERPSPKLYKTLTCIKKIRDVLAHLQPVPSELILEL